VPADKAGESAARLPLGRPPGVTPRPPPPPRGIRARARREGEPGRRAPGSDGAGPLGRGQRWRSFRGRSIDSAPPAAPRRPSPAPRSGAGASPQAWGAAAHGRQGGRDRGGEGGGVLRATRPPSLGPTRAHWATPRAAPAAAQPGQAATPPQNPQKRPTIPHAGNLAHPRRDPCRPDHPATRRPRHAAASAPWGCSSPHDRTLLIRTAAAGPHRRRRPALWARAARPAGWARRCGSPRLRASWQPPRRPGRPPRWTSGGARSYTSCLWTGGGPWGRGGGLRGRAPGRTGRPGAARHARRAARAGGPPPRLGGPGPAPRPAGAPPPRGIGGRRRRPRRLRRFDDGGASGGQPCPNLQQWCGGECPRAAGPAPGHAGAAPAAPAASQDRCAGAGWPGLAAQAAHRCFVRCAQRAQTPPRWPWQRGRGRARPRPASRRCPGRAAAINPRPRRPPTAAAAPRLDPHRPPQSMRPRRSPRRPPPRPLPTPPPHRPSPAPPGTLQGAAGRMSYLQKLGVDAVWVTPVAKQCPQAMYGSTAYHGYWPVGEGPGGAGGWGEGGRQGAWEPSRGSANRHGAAFRVAAAAAARPRRRQRRRRFGPHTPAPSVAALQPARP
jgi:hypothetical protein